MRDACLVSESKGNEFLEFGCVGGIVVAMGSILAVVKGLGVVKV